MTEPASLHSAVGAGAGAPARRRALALEDYVEGVRSGDRTMLARAITLIESRAASHQDLAQSVLQRLLPHSGRARRMGVSGVPGAGKSTFIEALGCQLCRQGHHLAVLTIDPSSVRTGGSILGDKTRMEQLNREPNAFIRPSPAGSTLGGVARRTRETMLVCEAAGYDVILVETVGVGQSEVTVRSMVDFFLLLLVPGAGDELQGIKKGIMELADAVLVNKAEGENRLRAEQSRAEYAAALHYLAPATSGWRTEVGLCSALTGEGVTAVWEMIERFYRELEPQGVIARQRQAQTLSWLEELIRAELHRRFFGDARVKRRLAGVQAAVASGELTPVHAAQSLFEAFDLHALSLAGGGRQASPSERAHFFGER
jgi:LAO/AO transport system kinase